MSKVTVNVNVKEAAGVAVNVNGKKVAGKGKGIRDPFASREVDRETERQVIKLIIELHRDTLRELAHH